MITSLMSPLATSLMLALPAALMFAACNTMPGAKPIPGDANGDGYLDAAELETHTTLRMMAVYDANGDGSISFAEWQVVSPEADKARFQRADANGDGGIDADELRAVVRRHPTFGRLMESVDTDGDGRASRAELDAFGGHIEEI